MKDTSGQSVPKVEMKSEDNKDVSIERGEDPPLHRDEGSSNSQKIEEEPKKKNLMEDFIQEYGAGRDGFRKLLSEIEDLKKPGEDLLAEIDLLKQKSKDQDKQNKEFLAVLTILESSHDHMKKEMSMRIALHEMDIKELNVLVNNLKGKLKFLLEAILNFSKDNKKLFGNLRLLTTEILGEPIPSAKELADVQEKILQKVEHGVQEMEQTMSTIKSLSLDPVQP